MRLIIDKQKKSVFGRKKLEVLLLPNLNGHYRRNNFRSSFSTKLCKKNEKRAFIKISF